MDLHWRESEDGKSRGLFVGCNEREVATIVKATKWWNAVIWLPDLYPAKQYAPLEKQVADVEEKVQRWFDLANTDRPVTDRIDQ